LPAPVISEPVTPVSTEPVLPAPVMNETVAPVSTKPVLSAPVSTKPVLSAPVISEPVTPVSTETVAPVSTKPVLSASTPVFVASESTKPVLSAPALKNDDKRQPTLVQAIIQTLLQSPVSTSLIVTDPEPSVNTPDSVIMTESVEFKLKQKKLEVNL